MSIIDLIGTTLAIKLTNGKFRPKYGIVAVIGTIILGLILFVVVYY